MQQGRWGGRLTRRPLPECDTELEALSDGERAELVEVWLARAASERRVSDAFVVIEKALRSFRGKHDILALATRGIDDELRHAELSRVVASRFAGTELDAPARLQLVVPEHRGAPERLLPSLHVLGHCALNETFASAYLEVSLHAATGALARTAVQELLSDEIQHARIGWAHLAELPEMERKKLHLGCCRSREPI